jgi:hypothetical protein
VRAAWPVVEAMWAPTMARAATLPEADLWRSVRGEWCFADTLRHLVLVVDAWLGRAVLGDDDGFHPLGMPAAVITDGVAHGIDGAARPTYAEVVAAREDRMGRVRDFVATVTDDELMRPRRTSDRPGWPPPPGERTPLRCLSVILNEEWAHHQFAVRDLDLLAAGWPGAPDAAGVAE